MVGLLAALLLVSPSARAETAVVPASGSFVIDGHGYGHGHGLSQYGARGAARAGLGAAQILAFYYPGTGLASRSGSLIRVAISDNNGDAQVQATSGMFLSWPGGAVALPVDGIYRWRLVPSGGALTLQYLTTTWTTWLPGIPSLAYFSALSGTVRLYAGSLATDYRGQVGATTTGGFTVLNRVDLDGYVEGVLPREMPSGWEAEALRAQAIAARTYGEYAVEHNSARPYDICDSDSCQVYGGMARYQSGQYAYGETAASNAAVTSTAGEVLTFGGAAIFAQFSAADGGWTAAGGQPYLVARADPYEAGSGSPWTNWTRTVSAASVAAQLGLRSVTSIDVLSRDGNGEWGGRVLSARINGTTSAGPTSIPMTGIGAAAVLGLPHQWFHVRQSGILGTLDGYQSYGRFGVELQGWAVDGGHPDQPTQVQVFVQNGASSAVTADRPRPDVQAYLTTTGDRYGFHAVAWLPPGGGTACAYAMSLDGSRSLLLGCVTTTPPVNPTGHVDQWGYDAYGRPTVRGWGFDWGQDGGSTLVRAYYGTTLLDAPAADVRPDVASVFGLANDREGFLVTMPPGVADTHVCVWILNTGVGVHELLQCRYLMGGHWV